MGDPPCTLAGRVVQETPWYQSVVDTLWSVLNGIAFLCALQQLIVLSGLLSLQRAAACANAEVFTGSCVFATSVDKTQLPT